MTNVLDKAIIGRRGEEIAEAFLKKKGYKIIARNYNTPRWGEIDRIAVHQDTLVFVEVRTKTSDEFLAPQESITPHKLHVLARAVQYFVLENEGNNLPQAMRIDFVGVTLDKEKKPEIEHFESITH